LVGFGFADFLSSGIIDCPTISEWIFAMQVSGQVLLTAAWKWMRMAEAAAGMKRVSKKIPEELNGPMATMLATGGGDMSSPKS